MSIELQVLTWGVVLGLIHIVAASHAKSLQYGYRWSASARDESKPALTGVAGRLGRAAHNYLETFPFFATLVLVAQAAHVHNALTVWGSCLYIGARIVYLPLYAFGVYLVRSLVWDVAVIGMVLFLIALLHS